jgi:hypothetical protein
VTCGGCHALDQQRQRKGRGTHEVNADGRDVAFSVGIVRESKQQARLSNTGVTDEQELEEVVVSIKKGSDIRNDQLTTPKVIGRVTITVDIRGKQENGTLDYPRAVS